jgi:uncharacterized DUF497 family protein
MIDPAKITDFDWDEGNTRKNDKHGVSMAEAEQVFFKQPLLLIADTIHSQGEPRLHALGKTNEARTLHITFTLQCRREDSRDFGQRHAQKGAHDL